MSMQNASPTITLCTAAQFGCICVSPAVVSDTCVNFTGGLTTLNEEVGSAIIPAGFICTFFKSLPLFFIILTASMILRLLYSDSVKEFNFF